MLTRASVANTDFESAAAAAAESAHNAVTEIRPNRGWLDLDLGQVWRYRELLIVLVMRDIQVLYRQAALGAAWAVIQPLFAVFIFTVVFGRFARMPSDGIPYAIFAFAAVLPWTYFAEALRRSASGLVTEAELVKKVYFPRLLIPVAAVTAPLLDIAIAAIVFFVMMLAYGVEPTWRLIAFIPLTAFTGLLALAIGLWLAPINARFRDIKHTLPFLITVWMYGSPIIYPLSIVPEEWQALYSLNPMVGVIEGFRWAAFGGAGADMNAMAIGAGILALLLFGGLVFFKHMERTFADVI